MTYQLCKQPQGGFIFKTGMVIADVHVPSMEKYRGMRLLVVGKTDMKLLFAALLLVRWGNQGNDYATETRGTPPSVQHNGML